MFVYRTTELIKFSDFASKLQTRSVVIIAQNYVFHATLSDNRQRDRRCSFLCLEIDPFFENLDLNDFIKMKISILVRFPTF